MGKKLGRSKKKSWKKDISLKDVDEFMENERLKERIGIKSDVTHIISTEGNDDPSSDKNRTVKDSIKKRRKDKKSPLTTSEILQGLKCYKGLESLTAVPPPKCPLPSKQSAIVTRKNKRVSVSVPSIKKKNAFMDVYDMWSSPEANTKDENTFDPDMEKTQIYLMGKPTPRPPPMRFQKPNLLPAIDLPHSGMSYNPDPKAHDELTQKVAQLERVEEMKVKKLNDKTTRFYTTKSMADREKDYMDEMAQGLGLEDSDDEGDDQLDESEEEKKNHVGTVRKSKKERKKEMGKKLIEEKRRKVKHDKNLVKDTEAVGAMVKKIKKEEKEKCEKLRLRDLKGREKKLLGGKTKKRLAQDLIMGESIPLPEEMTGSLRTIAVRGNLLKDRFTSLGARNLIAKTVKRPHKTLPKKLRVKSYVKRQHKEIS